MEGSDNGRLGGGGEGEGSADGRDSVGRAENSPKGSKRSSSSSNRGGTDSSSLDITIKINH